MSARSDVTLPRERGAAAIDLRCLMVSKPEDAYLSNGQDSEPEGLHARPLLGQGFH